MPHIIVEYSDTLNLNVPQLLTELHENLAAEETVNVARLKTRAVPIRDFIVGDKGPSGQMVHVVLKVLPRPNEVAKRMACNLKTVVRNHVAPETSVTVEVVELNGDTYCL
jgi:5-carboxymethyl-2-hydroxymuconate isomerase